MRRESVLHHVLILTSIGVSMVGAARAANTQPQVDFLVQESSDIPLGSACAHAAGIGFTPDFGFALVPCQDTNNVALIDTAQRLTVDHISLPAGDTPWDVVVSGDGARAYVTNTGFRESTGQHLTTPGTVSVIDLATRQVINEIVVGVGPNGLARHGNRLFVANTRSNSVSVIDLASNLVTQTIAVGQAPFQLKVSGDGQHLLVVNFYDASITVVDASSYAVERTVVVGAPALQQPFPEFGEGDTVDLILTSGLSGWAANFRSQEIVQVNLASGAVGQRVSLPGILPSGIHDIPGSGRMFVTPET